MKKIIPVVSLATALANIKRTVGYYDGHLENDAEHSYQLALACWLANAQYSLSLNDELILKFALVHDLVEIFAGDTDAYSDKEKIELKKENEEKALQKLRAEYGLEEITCTIDRYNKMKDAEAKLVCILDKFIPDINIYNSKSDYYKIRKVDVERWKKWLFSKIDYDSLDQNLKQLVDESIKIDIDFNIFDHSSNS